jgi:hypothetical protein
MDCFLFFFSDWNVLLYLWSHVPGTGSETIWVYILYVLLVSHILTFLHMVKTMHILNRHFGISEFEIVWYVYPRGVPIVDVPIFFLYPRILSDCTCPTLSAVHVPMIVSCKQKNMAILFFTQQFILTTHFSKRVREKYFNYLSQSLTLCGVFIKDSTTNIINITPHAYNLFKNEWREANGLCCRVSLAKRGELFPSVLVLLFSYTHSTKLP